MTVGQKLQLFWAGAPVGWLGEDSGQWCIVASSGGAVAVEWYTLKGVNYLRRCSDSTRFLLQRAAWPQGRLLRLEWRQRVEAERQ